VARKPDSTPSDEVYSITAARRPHQADMDSRMVKYLVSMSIRTLCFVLVLVTPSPWRWFFAVGAIVLPYVAVIVANAGGERRGPAPQPVVQPPAPEAPVRLALGEATVIVQHPAPAPASPPPAAQGPVPARTGAHPAHPR